MFCVIYRFQVIEGQEEKFIQAWKELTSLIRDYENSLGSRIHHEGGQIYIAYAQWPNRKRWKESGSLLPEAAKNSRIAMKAACGKIETLHELELVEDLLI